MKRFIVLVIVLWAGVAFGAGSGTGTGAPGGSDNPQTSPSPDNGFSENICPHPISMGGKYIFTIDGVEHKVEGIEGCTRDTSWVIVKFDKGGNTYINIDNVSIIKEVK